jgi:hypothetical protein
MYLDTAQLMDIILENLSHRTPMENSVTRTAEAIAASTVNIEGPSGQRTLTVNGKNRPSRREMYPI